MTASPLTHQSLAEANSEPTGPRFALSQALVELAAQTAAEKSGPAGQIPPTQFLLRIATAVLRPGDRVLNLGADPHFALQLASWGCVVAAVESTPERVTQLRELATAHDLANLQVLETPWGQQNWGEQHAASGHLEALLDSQSWQFLRWICVDSSVTEPATLGGLHRLLEQPTAPLLYFVAREPALALDRETVVRREKLLTTLRGHGYYLYRRAGGVLRPECEVEPALEWDWNHDCLAAKALPLSLQRWTQRPPRPLWKRLAQALGMARQR